MKITDILIGNCQEKDMTEVLKEQSSTSKKNSKRKTKNKKLIEELVDIINESEKNEEITNTGSFSS